MTHNLAPKVGIEAIAYDLPEHFIRLEQLALARQIDPKKFLVGLGQKEMSVPAPCEDTVVLAVGAGQKLLTQFGTDPNSIGLLIVGTETGVDHSKPVSSYVHGLLGLGQNCRVFETKHACYGGTAGVISAMNWIQSGRAKGKKALVIASDIAYYGLKTPGEATQGGGAVALLISDHPKLLEFDPWHEGYYSNQVMDFWRPLYSKEAFADGHYSIQCYLDALAGAYSSYRQSVLQSEASGIQPFSERFHACLYHVPFAKMAQKAHLRLLEVDAERAFEKDSAPYLSGLADFKTRVEPWLEMNERVGNIYTGSVFLSLYNYLQKNAHSENIGKFVSIFSYGSGCAAEFIGARVGEEIQLMNSTPSFFEDLNKRKELTFEKYESMISAYSKADVNGAEGCDPSLWNLDRRLVYLGTYDHKRRYEFI